jgi:hypothetical protein
MSHLDPNDVVVAELDVVVSNQLASLATQLVMLQQPLRPNWRPYNTGMHQRRKRRRCTARRCHGCTPFEPSNDAAQWWAGISHVFCVRHMLCIVAASTACSSLAQAAAAVNRQCIGATLSATLHVLLRLCTHHSLSWHTPGSSQSPHPHRCVYFSMLWLFK